VLGNGSHRPLKDVTVITPHWQPRLGTEGRVAS